MSDAHRPVRVRIAPSPTGNCHVGTARSALYNQLFARQHGGACVLRIDDTDQKRSTEDSEAGIYASLRWLGLSWDEGPDVGGPFGPYRQSERLERYREASERLLHSGRAYRCFCTPSELEDERRAALARGAPPRYSGRCRQLTATRIKAKLAAETAHVLRLRIAPKLMTVEDLVQGPVVQDAALLGDPVIVKSDGMPVYHFATVVDEHEMAISHVIRGAEHLNNTFAQLQMYEALGFPPPAFAHLGLLLNPDRSKIGKRSGAIYIGEFAALGYLPEAMINHLALSGWSPGTNTEVYTFDELLQAFSLDRCSPSNAVFDRDKLLWLNGVHIRALPVDELTRRVRPFLVEAGLVDAPATGNELNGIVALEQERLKTLNEAPAMLSYFFREPDPAATVALLAADRFTRKRWGHELREGLVTALQTLGAPGRESWTVSGLSSTLNDLVVRLGWKRSELFMAIRIAVSGKQATPSLFETLEALGRAATLRRLGAVLNVLHGFHEQSEVPGVSSRQSQSLLPPGPVL
jgi:glutamyl-tRNA synthetase